MLESAPDAVSDQLLSFTLLSICRKMMRGEAVRAGGAISVAQVSDDVWYRVVQAQRKHGDVSGCSGSSAPGCDGLRGRALGGSRDTQYSTPQLRASGFLQAPRRVWLWTTVRTLHFGEHRTFGALLPSKQEWQKTMWSNQGLTTKMAPTRMHFGCWRPGNGLL